MKALPLLFFLACTVVGSFFLSFERTDNRPPVGEPIDSLFGVKVFYNGAVGHVRDRNISPEGYNLGLRWQCVEFAKRYYYEHFGHFMPDSFGHAKDFFEINLHDGAWNSRRALYQFDNPSIGRPRVSQIIIFRGTAGNPFGHIAIISSVSDTEIEIIQQNPGPYGQSRMTIPLRETEDGLWYLAGASVLGRLGSAH